MKAEKFQVTVDQLATLLEISKRQVQYLAKLKILPRKRHGLYDLRRVVPAWVDYKQGNHLNLL